jgi:hypothetical protein
MQFQKKKRGHIHEFNAEYQNYAVPVEKSVETFFISYISFRTFTSFPIFSPILLSLSIPFSLFFTCRLAENTVIAEQTKYQSRYLIRYFIFPPPPKFAPSASANKHKYALFF